MALLAVTRRAPPVLWAALVAVVVIIAHLPSFFHRLLDGDEAIYGSIAALVNAGGQLYAQGGVDNPRLASEPVKRGQSAEGFVGRLISRIRGSPAATATRSSKTFSAAARSGGSERRT